MSDLPRTETLHFYDPEGNGDRMDFRLIYRGSLPSAGSGRKGARVKEKHTIRKHFHRQLRELWKQHPHLRDLSKSRFVVTTTPDNWVSYPGPGVRQISPADPLSTTGKTWLEHMADDHQRCGTRWVPLVRKAGEFTCSLDILFLRRDSPGSLIDPGGDIDNRIKVLFDGLKMPETVSDLGDIPLESDEDPFFCLLEDDSLITSVSITTDRLLTPQESDENIHDVCLIIHATVLNPAALFAGNRLL